MNVEKFQVLLFYKYVSIVDPKACKVWYDELCATYNLKGRTIIAQEGINGTLEGTYENTEAFVVALTSDERFRDIHIKRSAGTGNTFPKCSVKIRDEIVGTKFPKEIDPTKDTGVHLAPEELRSWYEHKKDFVVIDMRNSYEYASGHFKDSIDPGMNASRELGEKIEQLQAYKDKTVLTVCTGGVRCEKMSAYLKREGFKDVYQLAGGIHAYMEKYPGKDFLGTLFTFDNRLTLDFGGEREVVGVCKHCGSKTETYQNCSNAACNLLFLVCNNCVVDEKVGYCSSSCAEHPVRIVNRVRM